MLSSEPKEHKSFCPDTRPGGLVTGVTRQSFMCKSFMCLFCSLFIGQIFADVCRCSLFLGNYSILRAQIFAENRRKLQIFAETRLFHLACPFNSALAKRGVLTSSLPTQRKGALEKGCGGLRAENPGAIPKARADFPAAIFLAGKFPNLGMDSILCCRKIGEEFSRSVEICRKTFPARNFRQPQPSRVF